MARRRIEREIPGVTVAPRVMDYTDGDDRRFHLGPMDEDESRLVLYIGSSIGNFEPHQAARLLRRVRAGLEIGDAMLLGVDLAKDKATLVAAYDDAAGVTAAFNKNILVRLNRELDADFDAGDIRAPRGVEQGGVKDGDAPGEPDRPEREYCRARFDSRFRSRRDHPHREQLQIPARPGRSAARGNRLPRRGNLDRP